MDRNKRLRDLRVAVKAIEVGRPKRVKVGRKLSISSVAEEAGISPSTIHTRYPEIVDLLRQKGRGSNATQNERNSSEVKRLKGVVADLRAKWKGAELILAKVTSELATVQTELEQYKSAGRTGNVHPMPTRPK